MEMEMEMEIRKDDQEGGVQDTGLFSKGRVARRRQQLGAIRLPMLSVVATCRLVERLVALALDLRVVVLASCRACEENADGREQRKKEEVTMVSIDTCLPPNYPHDDVHRCSLPSAFPSQASFSPLLTRVSMPPADTAKRSLQPRSGPSVAPETH